MTDNIVIDVAENEQQPPANTAQTDEQAAAQGETQNHPLTLELDPATIPEKFRKDPHQIFKSYSELESELGRSRNEIGTWRSLVEDLSSLKREQDLAQTQHDDPIDVTSDSLLADPVEAISQVVARTLDARLKPLEESLSSNAAKSALSKLTDDFPDWQSDAASPDFQEWAAKRPSRLADASLAAQGDIAAVRRLMDNYADVKETKQTQTTEPVAKAKAGVEAARKVATERSGNSDGASGKKIFTQHEVVQKIINDPEGYRSQAYQDEMMAAMREGRYRQ